MGEAFDAYWRKTPNVKRLEFPLVRDPSTRMAMLRRGEVDEVDVATLLTDVNV